jgi:hypothetical protein
VSGALDRIEALAPFWRDLSPEDIDMHDHLAAVGAVVPLLVRCSPMPPSDMAEAFDLCRVQRADATPAAEIEEGNADWRTVGVARDALAAVERYADEHLPSDPRRIM